MNPSIIKAYDIRGIVGKEITVKTARDLGRAFGRWLRRRVNVVPAVVLGRDCRTFSPELAAALTASLTQEGIDVIDAGITPSPMHYWIVGHEGADGGILVTASHNSKEYNGFKLTSAGAVPIDGAAIREIVEPAEDKVRPPSRVGKIERRNFLADFTPRYALSELNRSYRIVIDASNGVAGEAFSAMLSSSPQITLIPLNFKPDPSFPAHEPNPVAPGATDELVSAVRAEGADLGAIVDGDGDRILFADETGTIRYGDEWGSLFIREVLTAEPGAPIVVTAAAGRMLLETIKQFGGKAVVSKVGHTFIKKAMAEADAPLGVEFNGHFYFRENFYTEDSYAALALLIRVLDRSGVPASRLTEPFRRYLRGSDRVFRVRDAESLIRELKERYRSYNQDELDGLSVLGPGWWFNIRPSNTEPVVRFNADADDLQTLERLTTEISDAIRGYERQ